MNKFIKHIFGKRIINFFILTVLGSVQLSCTQMLMAPPTSSSSNLVEQVAEAAVEASGGVHRSFVRRVTGFIGSCLTTAITSTLTTWKGCPLWIKAIATIGISCFSVAGAAVFGSFVALSSIMCWGMDAVRAIYQRLTFLFEAVSGLVSTTVGTVVEVAKVPIQLISNTCEGLGVPKVAAKPFSTLIFICMACIICLAAFSWIKAKSQERKEAGSSTEKLKGIFLDKSGKRKPLNEQKKAAQGSINSIIAVLGIICFIGWFIGPSTKEDPIGKNVSKLQPVDEKTRFFIDPVDFDKFAKKVRIDLQLSESKANKKRNKKVKKPKKKYDPRFFDRALPKPMPCPTIYVDLNDDYTPKDNLKRIVVYVSNSSVQEGELTKKEFKLLTWELMLRFRSEKKDQKKPKKDIDLCLGQPYNEKRVVVLQMGCHFINHFNTININKFMKKKLTEAFEKNVSQNEDPIGKLFRLCDEMIEDRENLQFKKF